MLFLKFVIRIQNLHECNFNKDWIHGHKIISRLFNLHIESPTSSLSLAQKFFCLEKLNLDISIIYLKGKKKKKKKNPFECLWIITSNGYILFNNQYYFSKVDYTYTSCFINNLFKENTRDVIFFKKNFHKFLMRWIIINKWKKKKNVCYKLRWELVKISHNNSL